MTAVDDEVDKAADQFPEEPLPSPDAGEDLPVDGGDDDEELPPDEADELGDVADHLKDAVEGSMRLKRLLTEDQAADPKRRKMMEDEPRDPEAEKVEELLIKKWASSADALMRHVLRQMTLEELNYLNTSGYRPEKNNAKRSAAELTAQTILKRTETKMIGQSKVDIVTAFRATHKLSMEDDKALRALNHKDLRYIITNYDGEKTIPELIEEASCEEPPAEADSTGSALPSDPGPLVMSRFNRVELIDPFADCAVFGDANLTFSMNLAAHRTCLGHVGRVIATTFEEIDTLRGRYPEIDESIKTLESHDAEVYHGVDCTRVAVDPRFKGMEGTLGAVYYNFPHSGAIQGFFDSHPIVNWRHENLMRLFFRALRTFVKPGGIVKIASNSSATGVRYSFIVGGAIENEFEHIETMPFQEWCLHRYGRSYGDRRDAYKRPDAKNNQSYNAQNANSDMVYCFRYNPSGKVLGRQVVRMPPSLHTLNNCMEGPFKKLPSLAARHKLAQQLHERFMTEISGTHVG